MKQNSERNDDSLLSHFTIILLNVTTAQVKFLWHKEQSPKTNNDKAL